MSKVSQWSTTASSNNSSPPSGWPEGMARSAVNDCAREMMASLARWYTDQKGTLLTAGTGTAYTLTSSTVHAALADQGLVVFRAHTANTGAATLNVDGLGARSIFRDFNVPLGSGDIQTNQLVMLAYNPNQNTYEWLNAPATTVALVEPQGYLTPISGFPVLSSDAAGQTSVFYTPFKGNMIPIYNGTRWTNRTFSELTLALSANHLANTIYDVFIWDNAGTMAIATGPAWTNSAAGAGARGSGAGTTQLTRLNGRYVNTVAATVRNGGSTFALGATLGTYVGSIWIDAVAGQITVHCTFGQTRKHGVWNAYNRRPIQLIAGDPTASWLYGSTTIRASNGNAANSLSTFTGLLEETVQTEFTQRFGRAAIDNSSITSFIGIGVNTTTSMFDTRAGYNQDTDASIAVITTPTAKLTLFPTIGRNTIQALESGSGSNTTFFGTSADMRLTATYMA